MIDVHCHLNFHAYNTDRDELIAQALKQGLEIIINAGTQLDSSYKAVELAEQYEKLYAIVGVHPHHADKISKSSQGLPVRQGLSGIDSGVVDTPLNDDWVDELEKLAKHPKVVAIGEIGLDYFSYSSNGIVEPKLQQEIFEKQLVLAHKLNLPLQIHNRQAGKDILAILKQHQNLLKRDYPGMFHCFAGDLEVLKQVLDLGFAIGFDGNLTYKGLAPGETVALSELAKATPLDRIVTETDSPFLTPVPYRGKRNHPVYVIIVAQFLAKLKQISFAEMRAITVANARQIFNLN